jgi:hypothetical protein
VEITALTELDAVNNIIGTIGESPINSLENLANVDAINALRILREVSRQEQARGWSFNIIKEHHLTPDYYTNRILWNDHYLSLKGTNGEKLVRDGKYIKNLTNGSIYFTSYVVAEAVLLIPFDELPEAMRSYIIAKSCYLFQSRYFGDDTLIKVTQAQIADAWQQLMEFEVDNNDYTWFDNQHIQELLSR